MKTEHKILSALAVATAVATIGAAAVSAAGLGESVEGVKPFSVESDYPISITVPLEGNPALGAASITADFEAGMLPAGDYKLSAREVVDNDAVSAFFLDAGQGADAFDLVVVDISLYTADGQEIHDVTPTITLTTENSCFFNIVAVYQDGQIERLVYLDNENEYPQANKISAKANHLSRFIFASLISEVSRIEDEPIAPPPDDDEKNTESQEILPNGDNSTTSSDDSKTNNTDNSKADTSVKPETSEGYKTGDNGNTAALVFAVLSAAALGTALLATKSKKSTK